MVLKCVTGGGKFCTAAANTKMRCAPLSWWDSSKAASSPHQASGTWHGLAVLSLESLEWWTKHAALHLHLLCGLPCKAAPPWIRGVRCSPSLPTGLPAPQSWDESCLSHFPVLWHFLTAKPCWCCLWLLTVVGRNESSCRGKHLTALGGEGALLKIGCKSRATPLKKTCAEVLVLICRINFKSFKKPHLIIWCVIGSAAHSIFRCHQAVT